MFQLPVITYALVIHNKISEIIDKIDKSLWAVYTAKNLDQKGVVCQQLYGLGTALLKIFTNFLC